MDFGKKKKPPVFIPPVPKELKGKRVHVDDPDGEGLMDEDESFDGSSDEGAPGKKAPKGR